jgi:hypothetical protein
VVWAHLSHRSAMLLRRRAGRVAGAGRPRVGWSQLGGATLPAAPAQSSVPCSPLRHNGSTQFLGMDVFPPRSFGGRVRLHRRHQPASGVPVLCGSSSALGLWKLKSIRCPRARGCHLPRGASTHDVANMRGSPDQLTRFMCPVQRSFCFLSEMPVVDSPSRRPSVELVTRVSRASLCTLHVQGSEGEGRSEG